MDVAGVALWSWNVGTDDLLMDRRGFELRGAPHGAPVKLEHLSEKIHPSDRDQVRAPFTATRATVGPYEIDFRTLTEDEVRWISARGQRDDAAMVKLSRTGVFLDITGRQQAEKGHERLAGEMSHRVKNLLAIAAGLTRLTSRSATSAEGMARQLMQRLTALDRAHDLVRPLPRPLAQDRTARGRLHGAARAL